MAKLTIEFKGKRYVSTDIRSFVKLHVELSRLGEEISDDNEVI